METNQISDWRSKDVLSVDEAAGILAVHAQTVRAGIRAGDVPHIRIGRRVLVPVAGLAKMLAAGTLGERVNHA